MSTKTTVGVQILESKYLVSCTEAEVDELRASARDLDARMRDVRGDGKVLGLDRIAVIAALNIAHDNLRLRKRLDAAGVDCGELARRVESALAELQSSA